MMLLPFPAPRPGNPLSPEAWLRVRGILETGRSYAVCLAIAIDGQEMGGRTREAEEYVEGHLNGWGFYGSWARDMDPERYAAVMGCAQDEVRALPERHKFQKELPSRLAWVDAFYADALRLAEAKEVQLDAL